MRKAHNSLSYLLVLFLSLPCAARTLLPVIQLSAEESASAKQLAEALKDAGERSAAAKIAWQQFHQLYQTEHPNLPNLRFTEDFRLAVATMNSSTRGMYQSATIELTVEERQKLQALHREMTQSDESQRHAENNWKDFKIQLVIKHMGTSTTGNGGAL